MFLYFVIYEKETDYILYKKLSTFILRSSHINENLLKQVQTYMRSFITYFILRRNLENFPNLQQKALPMIINLFYE